MKNLVIRSLIVMLSLASVLSFFGCKTDDSSSDDGNGKVVAAEYRGNYFAPTGDKMTLTKDRVIIYYKDIISKDFVQHLNFDAWTEGNELWAFTEEQWIDKSKSGSKTKVNFNIGILGDGTCDLRNKFDVGSNYNRLWTKE